MTGEPVVVSGPVSPVDQLDLAAIEADLASPQVRPLLDGGELGSGPIVRIVRAASLLVAERERLRASADDVTTDNLLDEARDEITDLQTAVERVRALHRHLTDEQGIEYCEWCDDNGADYGHELPLWPCPTIRALDGAT